MFFGGPWGCKCRCRSEELKPWFGLGYILLWYELDADTCAALNIGAQLRVQIQMPFKYLNYRSQKVGETQGFLVRTPKTISASKIEIGTLQKGIGEPSICGFVPPA